jgi:CHAT domain-containing protein
MKIRVSLVPDNVDTAEALHALGVVLVRRKHSDEAIHLFERAVSTLERQTGRLGGTEEVRSGFRAKYGSYYRDYIDALLSQGQPDRAFYVHERSSARSLLAMLAERDLVFAADLSPDIQRERKLNAVQYDGIQAKISELNPQKDAAQIGQLHTRLRVLAQEREQIAEQIKRTSPRFAALQYPQPLDVQGTRQALDPGTVMLSFSVGPANTDLFVVHPNGAAPGLSVHIIPVGERELRDRVKQFRDLLEEFGHLLDERPRPDASRFAANRAALDRGARALYDLLLKPAEAEFATSERLLFAPDGPLHALPFGALKQNEKQYLIEWKPLHTILSATLYAELKKTRTEHRSAPLQLAAFGDPLYPKLDGRSSNHLIETEAHSAAKRGFTLDRLLFSREEVTGIAALYPHRSQAYLGADATEERAKSVGPQAHYVHFATHAFLDEQLPLNSGLVLTIPEKLSEGQENGLLQAWEIFEQVRLDADLVVLSACQTGLGKELGGEGLIGLTRAFQYAGARSIAASLWNVKDVQTAQLMKRFYTHLQSGESKDEALRAAQWELLRSRSSSHPFYWAAFSLIGDWQ